MSENLYQTVEIPVRFWMFPLPNATRHQQVLNEMAQDGWELVTSNTVGINSFVEKIVLTFKKSGQS